MKIKWLLLILGVMLSCVSCDDIGDINESSPYSARQIAEIIIASQADAPDLLFLNPEDYHFNYYFKNIYKLGDYMPEEAVIYYSEEMLAAEIAVFLFADNINIEEKEEALLKYIRFRVSQFSRYDPKQAALAEKGIAVTHGRYAALLICDDPQAARLDFLACFSENPPEYIPYVTEITKTDEETPEIDDRIEINEIVDKERRILDFCKEIIAELITDGMSDYDKELAVHDWIINWADYDKEVNNNAPDASPDPDNDNPYGLLFRKKAICAGYSSTFQLFMDLLGIECITVNGFSGVDADGEHAWNMVRIEGEWYCVDVTWNDPSGVEQNDELTHKYFNVNSGFMRETTHHWDESAVPEATADKLYK